MKTKHLVTLVLIVMLAFPIISIAQQKTEVSKNNQVTEGWKALKIQAGGSNVMNGVAFYRKSSTCISDVVTLVKVINRNTYSVKIQWTLSSGTVVNVTIPASSFLEGACSGGTSTVDAAKLVFPKTETVKKGTEKNKLLSTLTVTKI
jgi:hypothetical protein